MNYCLSIGYDIIYDQKSKVKKRTALLVRYRALYLYKGFVFNVYFVR